MSATVDVQVEQDHLESLIHPSQPIRAVAELIWNAVDADANQVTVKVVENPLGGIESIRVEDDGSGMPFDHARTEFGHLGGSWKRNAERSKEKDRYLHGEEGRGRWRAYALGGRVRWISVATDPADGENKSIEITGNRTNLGRFTLSEPVRTAEETGTLVLVDQISETPEGLLSDSAVSRLTGEFATYLEQYPVKVVYRGTKLDPSALQTHRVDYPIDLPDGSGVTAVLTVVEWSEEVDRAIYLCDSHGTALERLNAGIQAPGFDFTAYLKWEGFRERQSELALAELGAAGLEELVESARDTLREHFKERSGEVTKALIEGWKTEQVYPYEREPETTIEAAERDLFDVVALAAAPAVNKTSDKTSKRLTLGLIKEALELSPNSLGRVLQQVLDLSEEKLEELDQLLSRTPLTSIIAAAKRIADRLDFLRGLEILLFDQESKRTLLERSQLHRILGGETWIFGEEFNLMASDRSLTAILEAHIKELGRSELAPDGPALDTDGKVRIVDLAFGRALKLNSKRREHLVVELKRPNVKLGQDELNQIENYAIAVASDERFDKTQVAWDFIVVGNELDAVGEFRSSQTGKPTGLVSEKDGIRVWVKTWGQIIEDAEHRLKFVQEALQYMPDDDQALDYLRETHGKYLPDSVTRDEPQ